MQKLLTKTHWIALAAITGLCIATLCMARVWFANTKYTALEMVPMPQPVQGFELYSTDTALFTHEQLKGYWNLIFFGFSHCVDICPMELEIMARVLKQLPAEQQKLRGVFVSLDPERDSQKHIEEYLAAFGQPIVGVRGNHAELVKLVRFFGADYNRLVEVEGNAVNIPAGYAVPLGNTQDYQVNHSARIYLVNPNGQYIGSFPPPHVPEHLLADLQMILKR